MSVSAKLRLVAEKILKLPDSKLQDNLPLTILSKAADEKGRILKLVFYKCDFFFSKGPPHESTQEYLLFVGMDDGVFFNRVAFGKHPNNLSWKNRIR